MVKHAVSQFLINQFIKQQRTKGHLQAVSIYYSYSARSSDSVYNMYKITINQSINVKFVRRRYTRRPGAPTVVSGTHDQKVHS